MGRLVSYAKHSSGIIVPLLYTADDAKRLVQFAKFPPMGQRGFGSPFPMEKFSGQTAAEYLQQANDSLVTIVQIETKEALENVSSSLHASTIYEIVDTKVEQINEIVNVPGIDVLFVGPYDLGNNLGFPILDGTMHEELKEAIAKVLQVAKENGKRTGIYCTSGDQARQYADQGFHMVLLGPPALSRL